MVQIFATHGLWPADDTVRIGAQSASSADDGLRRALRTGSLGVDYRPMWDLVDRQVVAFDAVPTVPDATGALPSADQIWAAAERAGLVHVLVSSMRASAERAQRSWTRFGLDALVTIARVPGQGRSVRRAFGRAWRRPLAPPTVSLDLDPEASHELFGLRPDRWWRVHLPAEEAAVEIRRVVGAGGTPLAARLSSSLVHRFTHDAARLTLVARCIEAARRHDLLVQADGVDDGESANGLLALGCHEASGAGLGADLLRAADIPTLRWVSPTMRMPSARPLRAVAG